MVWQEGVEHIVMLTNLKEGAKVIRAIFSCFSKCNRRTSLHPSSSDKCCIILFNRGNVSNIGQIWKHQ